MTSIEHAYDVGLQHRGAILLIAYGRPGVAADWAGNSVTSLVQSAPVGALCDPAGRVLLGWAATEAIAEMSIRVGVSEERKSFVVEIRALRPLDNDLTVIFDATGSPIADAVRRLAGWLSARCSGDVLVPPVVATLPVYSTWYTFTQDVNADAVLSEAALAARSGFGSVFIDDGWQQLAQGRGYQGCGDWLPDGAKFADLRHTVDTMRGMGLGVALWVAPLLLGQDSDVFGELAPFAAGWVPELNCHVLDPRFEKVREYVAATCVRLVRDYRADLLKVDFLDQAMIYRDSVGDGDIADVGHAMAAMLSEVRHRLAVAGHGDVGFEFRQPYVSPAAARYAQILRANDCPGDSMMNRLATIDARLIAVGQVVHSDPMMWGAAGGAEAVAQQLYSGWFSVPQISMRLSDLSELQASALHTLLTLWREQADVTRNGILQVQGVERGYDLVRADRPDLGRTVIARYAPLVIDLDESALSETTVINATADSNVILRAARSITGGLVRTAAGAVSLPIAAAAAGLLEITVPAFGSITVFT